MAEKFPQCSHCTLKRRVPLMSVCAVWMPYASAYLVLSRLGNPSRLKPGKKSIAVAESIRVPPAGMLTTLNTRVSSDFSFRQTAAPGTNSAEKSLNAVNVPLKLPYLAISEKDSWADCVQEDTVRTPAELVAKRIVWTLRSRKPTTEGAVGLHLDSSDSYEAVRACSL